MPGVIRRRFALALALAAPLLLPCAPQARTPRAQPPEPPLPSPPAAAPPAPARLDAPAAEAPAAPARRAPVAASLPGLESLADGSWRLRFPDAAAALPPGAPPALAELGRRLAAEAPPPGHGRYTVIAQASGPAADASAARRLSLARALAVKEALSAGGLAETRIDIRPLGRTDDAMDAVDVLPPGVQRAAAAP